MVYVYIICMKLRGMFSVGLHIYIFVCVDATYTPICVYEYYLVWSNNILYNTTCKFSGSYNINVYAYKI